MNLIINFLCVAVVYGRTAWGNPCQRSDSEVEECIRNKFQAIKPTLHLEPFQINGDGIRDDVTIDGNRLEATIKNVVANGGSNYWIDDLRVDLRNKYRYTGRIKVVIPHLDVTADYRFIVHRFINFVSTGKLVGKFNNIAVVFNCVASPYTMYGTEYLRVDSITTEIAIGNSELDLTPASWWSLAGNKIASHAHSKPSEVMRELTPTMERNAARLVKEYINDELAKVPLESMIVD